ncbi:MAG: hydantoinase B/oxoprolinase family protein [Balneolaceae bacterium]|nr:hydantoinase B/oxoprolinase family protein [Balneolaceae bacterium]
MKSDRSTGWTLWIDTGGTFTDCIGRDPEGAYHRVKVLSSSALRGEIVSLMEPGKFRIHQGWNAPGNLIKGLKFRLLEKDHAETEVESFDPERSLLTLNRPLSFDQIEGSAFEVVSEEEAPVLGARLVTQTGVDRSLPSMNLRLATTKGTNALLERKGAETILLITKGFKDLLQIGDQKRPDLFALEINKPGPLYARVVEIEERIDSDGGVHIRLDTGSLGPFIEQYSGREKPAVAIALMNSYRNSAHEDRIRDLLVDHEFEHISLSSELNPFIKIITRAQTAVVNGYLSPVLTRYLETVRSAVDEGSLRVMTSAGGLSAYHRFNPKDSLLSGPAGGVVGASSIGKQAGFDKVISFDMGGTSTDVSRYDSGFDYTFEHRVGEVNLAAPALSIETVAAGGGSICRYDGHKLSVGPESAGASPGPACYGAGGPLTLTDVNLLLGRLDAENFQIPIDRSAAEKAFEQLLEQLDQTSEREHLLEGFLEIANERMADAIRKISLRKGYNPGKYALVAFGGAGAQHACAIAGHLGMQHILIPANAGLLSAYGLGNAVVERFAETQLLETLEKIETGMDHQLDRLREEAIGKLREEGFNEQQTEIRRQLIFMRLKGQESTIEIEYNSGMNLQKAFKTSYEQRYGHWISDREVEIESIRVVASTRQKEEQLIELANADTPRPESLRSKEVQFNQNRMETPIYERDRFRAGHTIEGPAIILDPYSTIVLEPGWKSEMKSNGTLHLRSLKEDSDMQFRASESVALELFTNRFTSIAEEMGEMLRRTALSVNVKERLDFSCALLDREGKLVVNAPHIPVHLGALGRCIRHLKQTMEMAPGDVIVTNHPAFGGSHLPDITVVTPVFHDRDTLVGYAANRAHHAEIGGRRPGSMPPDATSLAEEGVVIPPSYLIREGGERWSSIQDLLEQAPYPTRNVRENMADMRAQVAANHRGVRKLKQMVDRHTLDRVSYFMGQITGQASSRMRKTIHEIPDDIYRSEETLDDGTPLRTEISVQGDQITVDFTGTGPVHPGNLNATPAIVSSVVIYWLRLLVNEPLPLNEGLLEPVELILPESLLNPPFDRDPSKCPAIVGGNVETSQRLVDTLLKPFNRIACSQGTMNNILFGNESFGYYETLGGGTGAGPDFDGTDAVHHHMTNTAGTDPEILEHHYPVRLDRYEIRRGSGGSGRRYGGNGIVREMTFMEPVSLSVLTQHRTVAPYGLEDGKPGATGEQWIVTANSTKSLGPVDGAELQPGNRFIIHTPGGGGFGKDQS